MSEIDKLRRAKLYMDKLSGGVDPNSGMRVHEDDIVRDSRVIACFEYISRVLEWEIESFENRPAAPEKQRRRQVFINDDQFSQLQLNYGECKEVFEKKFPSKIDQLELFFNGIKFEEFHSPEEIDEDKYPQIRDIKDLPILVSAILSDADILLTGDKDFEDIKIDKPLIFTPSKYFDLLENKF